MSPRRGDGSIARRGPSRPPKHRILVVCEGHKTEPLYLRAFKHHVRNPMVHVEVNDESGVPMTLVARALALRAEADAEAKQQRDDNLRWDEVWCVFDVDDHPRIVEARRQADASGVTLAVSNPCFELWALLHLREQTAWIDRHAAQRAVRKEFPRYGKELPFSKLIVGYPDAVRRAAGLDRRADDDGEPGRNPTTGVYRLTESIRSQGLGIGGVELSRRR